MIRRGEASPRYLGNSLLSSSSALNRAPINGATQFFTLRLISTREELVSVRFEILRGMVCRYVVFVEKETRILILDWTDHISENVIDISLRKN